MNLKFNEDGWTDWIQHDHKGCPVVGWYVKIETVKPFVILPNNYRKINDRHCEGVVLKDGTSWNGGAVRKGHKFFVRVARYKVRKPLGASELEEMLKDLLKVVDKEIEST